MTSSASTASEALYHQKNFLVLMIESSLAPKWPMLVHFCGMNHQKSKCPHLLKPLGTTMQQNYWSFFISEPIQKACFNMRHPVVQNNNIFQFSYLCTHSIISFPQACGHCYKKKNLCQPCQTTLFIFHKDQSLKV